MTQWPQTLATCIVYCCCVLSTSHVWSQMAADWESNCKKKWKQIRELAWRGVPNPMRTLIWPLLAGVRSADDTLKTRYPQLLAVSLGDFVAKVAAGCTMKGHPPTVS